MSLKLEATGDDLSSLWERIGNLRADAEVVKVEPQLLRRFLSDHRKLLQYAKETSEIVGPQ